MKPPLTRSLLLARLVLFSILCRAWMTATLAADPWLVIGGGEGPGKGRHIVFIAAEESYRSEESMPVMARILSRQGFKCTVLFAIDPADGTINPQIKDNIPGLEALESADLLVAFMRWRELPDEQMKRIIDYTESGRPILGIRNATHPFKYAKRKDSAYAKYDSAGKDPQGGWGRLVPARHGFHTMARIWSRARAAMSSRRPWGMRFSKACVRVSGCRTMSMA